MPVPLVIYEIKTYNVLFYGDEWQGNAAVVAGYFNAPGVFSVQMSFRRGAGPLPANSWSAQSNGKHYYLNFGFDKFGHVMDLLRNEKPVMMVFREDINMGYLFVSQEPVGEGEMAASLTP